VDDGHGHTNRDTVSIIVTPSNKAPADKTPPLTKPNISGTKGNNGWYTSDVHVTWDVTDKESNIISKSDGCNPTDITSDTTGQPVTCQATSAGGTTTQSVTIKIDSTQPTATSSQQGQTFKLKQKTSVIPVYRCEDATSGIDSCTTDTKTLDFSTNGTHYYSVTAIDKAGNVEDIDIMYKVSSPQLTKQPTDKASSPAPELN
jgi:hypothetical protein